MEWTWVSRFLHLDRVHWWLLDPLPLVDAGVAVAAVVVAACSIAVAAFAEKVAAAIGHGS